MCQLRAHVRPVQALRHGHHEGRTTPPCLLGAVHKLRLRRQDGIVNVERCAGGPDSVMGTSAKKRTSRRLLRPMPPLSVLSRFARMTPLQQASVGGSLCSLCLAKRTNSVVASIKCSSCEHGARTLQALRRGHHERWEDPSCLSTKMHEPSSLSQEPLQHNSPPGILEIVER